GAGGRGVGEVERLAPAGGPFGPGGEIADAGVLQVDLGAPRHGPQVEAAVLHEAHGSPVEWDGAGGEIHHGAEDAVEVEGGGDLAADLEDYGEVPRAAIGLDQLGVADGGGGADGQAFEKRAVSRREDPALARLHGDLDGADRDPAHNHGGGHDARDFAAVGAVHAGLEARVLHGAGDDRGFLAAGHVAGKAGADRHLGADQPLAGAAQRQDAAEHVVFRNPERAALRVQRGEHAVEDARKQLVEFERRVEFLANSVQEPEPLDLRLEVWRGAGPIERRRRHGPWAGETGCRAKLSQ